MKSLVQLYSEHQGKVSDKWSIYLAEYDRVFSSYRNSPIRMLEIGVQNGGSLEIWAKYFEKAEIFVGCDINTECSKLTYEDVRVKLVVGDANAGSTKDEILKHSSWFDIIIDDGSHVSSDIVKSFAHYFRQLNSGGVFIAEDLHCSYWKDFEGGLYHPFSSIAFFKRLVDVINHEHWGVEKERKNLIRGFSEEYDVDFIESELSKIHSIEFFNSVCVIRKCLESSNVLGDRVISGEVELVAPGHHGVGSKSVEPPQDDNSWTVLDRAPDEEWSNLSKALLDRDNKINHLNQFVSEIGEEVINLEKQVQSSIQQLESLERENVFAKQQAALSTQQLHEMTNSKSWKLTKPLRFSRRFVEKIGSGLINFPSNISIGSVEKEKNSEDFDLENKVDILKISNNDIAFESLSGINAETTVSNYVVDNSKLIAFYLPQYHRVEENSEWWGPGFTEWTNVVKGRPNFEGHYQPHLPRELGFYDISNVEVMREQAEMAKLYGVGAFCFYYYWFSGRRILDKPIDNFLSSDINIDYCLCWANENWTRTWDGDTKSVLMHQKYEEEDPLLFISSLLPHFNDQRYIRVNGKPMLVVYRAKDIPDIKNVFSVWRQKTVEAGFAGLHIAVVDFYDISTPDEVGADALVEFPPHKFNGQQNLPNAIPEFVNKDFSGGVIDYSKVAAQSAGRPRPDFDLYRGIIPSWDNTARRQNTSTITMGANPEVFGEWLKYLRAYTREVFPTREDNFIFINAWNEWGEGCHLEPDQQWGLRYLEAVKKSAFYQSEGVSFIDAKNNLLKVAAKKMIERNGQFENSADVLNDTMSHLINIKPIDGRVQKIAFSLKKYPLFYRLGRMAYRTYRKISG